MNPEPTIRINVDVTNPGQFFACCGLLELADRLWNGAEGWFDVSTLYFCVANTGPLEDLIDALLGAQINQVDQVDDTSSPIGLGQPFNLQVDWWKNRTNGTDLKVWAGSMRSCHIAQAMRDAIGNIEEELSSLFDFGCVVYEKDNAKKKIEPFYFDARRGPSAASLDIGFSPNTHKFTTIAHPAVEFLCLVGLQRCFPKFTRQHRVFEYFTWTNPAPTTLLPMLVTGDVKDEKSIRLSFENAYRTSQKKHKSFLPAQTLTKDY